MTKCASKVVEQAKAWLGYNESDGTHKQIIDVYNSYRPLPRGYAVKYTDAWCATFVSAVAITLGYTDILPPECGCEKMVKLFQKLDSWVENENRVPNPGDVIFYDWEDSGTGDNRGNSDHTGIVEKVSGNIITIIEGNYSNSVKRRDLEVNGKYIRGYGVPKYDTEPVETPTKTPTKTVTEIAKEVLNGKWGNGDARKTKLKEAGYDYSEVQAEVNRLIRASQQTKPQTQPEKGYSLEQFIRDVQGATGSDVDGKAGPQTIGNTPTVSRYVNREHPVVEFIQKRLYALGYIQVGEADGVAGPKFDEAMKAFQADNDCTADGEATAKNKTWQKLLNMK